MPRPPAFLVALVVALSACTQPSPAATSGSGPTTTSTVTTQPVTTESSSTTQGSITTSTIVLTAPPGTEQLPQALRDQIVELLGVTQETRELPFLALPNVAVVTDAELAERVRDQLEEDLDTADRDEALLIMLGLLPDGTDLAQLYLDLYGEQVGGYYDGETEELVVPSREDRFSPLQAMIMVHELTHAVTDQHYGYAAEREALADEQRWDEFSALTALAEGDAQFTSFQYLLTRPEDERLAALEESLQAQTEVFNSSPLYITEQLLFPYTVGLDFVISLHRRGGYARVGEIYGSPPISTEQIYSPRGFEEEMPADVDLPAAELAGYEVVEESTWGQLLFTAMFHQLYPGDEGEEAAAGWGGDSYRLYWDGEEVAIALLYQGDTEDDAGELGGALRRSVTSGMAVDEASDAAGGVEYTGDDYAFVTIEDDRVLFIAASDSGAGGALRESLGS